MCLPLKKANEILISCWFSERKSLKFLLCWALIHGNKGTQGGPKYLLYDFGNEITLTIHFLLRGREHVSITSNKFYMQIMMKK